MALLVVSLLLAALAPVMTKRMSDNVNVSGGTNNKGGNYTPCIPIGGSCNVPLDANIAGAIILSAGGGGGGAVPDTISTNKTNLGNITGSDNASNNATYQTSTYQLTETMRDLEIILTSGGGGGGGANGAVTSGNAPTKQSDCEPFGVYISASQNGGKAICVSKYNPGENRDGSPNLTGVTAVPVGTNCTGGNCCWTGKTASTCGTGTNGMTYSGCNRTVCQWNAANTICKNWKPINGSNAAGRLPTYAEFTAWKSTGLVPDNGGKPGLMNWNSSTNSGLQLCNASLNLAGASLCWPLDNGCLGASNNGCYPYDIWSGTSVGNNIYRSIALNGNKGMVSLSCDGKSNCSYTFAFSTRCIIDTISSQKLYTGGGGGAGIYVKVNVPNEVLERATNSTGKATLTLQAGNGGKGGSAKNTSRGVSGSPSIAKITDSNNTLIWYLEIPGGQGGQGASTTAGGALGSAGNISQCKYLDITNSNYSTLKTANCSSFPLSNVSQGEAGGKGDINTSYSTTGYGGRPKVENTFQGSRPQTPNGTSTTTINGNNAGSLGGGGAGGNCFNNNGTLTCGIGGYGKGGKAEAKYKKYTPGAAGGGGGAGTLIHIRNIQVKSGDEVKVSIGKGGNGGTSGANGAGGQNSYAIISGTKFEVTGGGGGRAATPGNPDTNVMAKEGGGGSASSIANATKNILSNLSASNYSIYPEDNLTTAGTNAPTLNLINNRIWTQSAGGNGGINEATFTQSIYPCGGLSTLTDNCNNISITPLTPTPKDDNQPPDYFDEQLMRQYPAGGTGGGGGAWLKGTGASAGANGMNGYVYVYFSSSGM